MPKAEVIQLDKPVFDSNNSRKDERHLLQLRGASVLGRIRGVHDWEGGERREGTSIGKVFPSDGVFIGHSWNCSSPLMTFHFPLKDTFIPVP